MRKQEKKSTGEIGRQRKKVILLAGETAFAQNGFKGTSIQMVAELANLPKTNLLYYFKTKLELYNAVMQEILHTWDSSFDQASVDDDPSAVLANYITEKMEMSRANPNASKIFALEILNGAHNFDLSFKKHHRAWFEGRITVIEAWIANGKMHNVCAEYLLYHIWASTQHYADFSAQITNLRGSKMKKNDYAAATNNLIAIILRGCGLNLPEHCRTNAS